MKLDHEKSKTYELELQVKNLEQQISESPANRIMVEPMSASIKAEAFSAAD